MSFRRTIEDFICDNCGTEVIGDGYTNHCPACLCSKHVDKDPGDRAQECGGLMAPIDVDIKRGDTYIVQQCLICGFRRRNKVRENDNKDVVQQINNKKLFG